MRGRIGAASRPASSGNRASGETQCILSEEAWEEQLEPEAIVDSPPAMCMPERKAYRGANIGKG